MPVGIRFKKGLRANLPTLAEGEPAISTDDKKVFVGTGTGNIELARTDGSGSDLTATFSQATSRVNIVTGEKLSVIFGKLMKWYVDLSALAWSGKWGDIADKPTSFTPATHNHDSAYPLKTFPDTRNDNQPPSWYWTNYPKQSVTEFKSRSVIGAPGTDTYGTLNTVVSWGDPSGGAIVQIFRSVNGTYERRSVGSTAATATWGAWIQVAAKPTMLTLTIANTLWTGTGPYTATVTAAGTIVGATQAMICSPDSASRGTWGECGMELLDTTEAGKATFQATEKPGGSVTARVILQEVG